MTCDALLNRISELGGRLFLSGDVVEYRLPDTSEARELLGQLRQNRDALMARLRCETDDIPTSDPATWEEDVCGWVRKRCRWSERDSTGLYALHNDFCDHLISKGSVPCHRQVFEYLLREAGFVFAGNQVCGLLLVQDFEYWHLRLSQIV
jgi:hypothetical protein